MDNENFDVIIVGSGVAGSVLAKTLTAAGKTVLMLEAGLDENMEEGKALLGNKAFKVQMSFLNQFYNALAKTPNSPYPTIAQAPSADVLDLKVPEESDPNQGYLVQKGPLPFSSDNLIAPGGTTQHWLGTTLRMLPNDFKMQSVYGRAVDWPISYHDLRPYYEMAEYEIGVSGDADDQKALPEFKKDYFSEGYVFPMKKIPQSYLDQKMMEKMQGLQVSLDDGAHTIACISTPQGRNSEPNPEYPISEVRWNKARGKLELIRGGKNYSYSPVGSLWDPAIGQRCEG